jgi:hypothetical protein
MQGWSKRYEPIELFVMPMLHLYFPTCGMLGRVAASGFLRVASSSSRECPPSARTDTDSHFHKIIYTPTQVLPYDEATLEIRRKMIRTEGFYLRVDLQWEAKLKVSKCQGKHKYYRALLLVGIFAISTSRRRAVVAMAQKQYFLSVFNGTS